MQDIHQYNAFTRSLKIACYAAGAAYSRPEPLYFWFYFNIVNSVWIIVPGLVMWYSAYHINRRVSHANLQKKFE